MGQYDAGNISFNFSFEQLTTANTNAAVTATIAFTAKLTTSSINATMSANPTAAVYSLTSAAPPPPPSSVVV
jgi:hypothetical protein